MRLGVDTDVGCGCRHTVLGTEMEAIQLSSMEKALAMEQDSGRTRRPGTTRVSGVGKVHRWVKVLHTGGQGKHGDDNALIGRRRSE